MRFILQSGLFGYFNNKPNKIVTLLLEVPPSTPDCCRAGEQPGEPEGSPSFRVWVWHDTGYKIWACMITVCTCLMMVEDLCKLYFTLINFHSSPLSWLTFSIKSYRTDELSVKLRLCSHYPYSCAPFLFPREANPLKQAV